MEHSTLSAILDRPIAFHRVFVTLTGSLKAAVLLGQALYWQRRCSSADGWWYKTAEKWLDEVGISEEELALARKQCKPILLHAVRGMPARSFYRVDMAALRSALQALPIQAPLPDVEDGISNSPELLNGGTSTRETRKQVPGKPGSSTRETRELPYCKETNKESTKQGASAVSVAQYPCSPELAGEAFRKAWTGWVDDRKERRKPVTLRAAELTMRNLAEMGLDGAIAALEQSVANGWTGVFPVRNDSRARQEAGPRRWVPGTCPL